MKRTILKSLLNICFGAITAIVFTSASAPYDVPGRPGRPVVTDIQNDQCDIKFEKPQNDGGSRITGYLVESLDMMYGKWEKECITQSCRCSIYNLIQGHEMLFRVIASNKVGFGEPSDPSNPVIIRGPFN